MSNEVIKRDPNHITVIAGIGNNADMDILMVRVDASTKRVIADITNTGSSSANASTIASRDQNHRSVCIAYDATNDVLQEVLTDENGHLLCDVNIE